MIGLGSDKKRKKNTLVLHNVVNAIRWLTSLSVPNTWPARPIRGLEVKREQKVEKKKPLWEDRPLTMDIDSHRGFHWEKTEKAFDKQPRQVLRFASLQMNKSYLLLLLLRKDKKKTEVKY